MSLSLDIVETLKRLGESPEIYEQLLESDGEVAVRRFVSGIAESAQLFDHWYPRLVEFAQTQRHRNPEPQLSDLDELTLAKHRILKSKIDTAEVMHVGGNHHAVILEAPIYAHSLLKELVARTRNAVLLTCDEYNEWSKLYQHPDEAFWWLAFQWWHIQESIADHDLSIFSPPPQLPQGTMPLVVKCGLQWGDLAGGETAELWSWDGTTEQYVSDFYVASY